MAQRREAWLDYVRVMSIFLVVLYHTPPRLPLLDEAVVLNLRMPVFFCISGFLFNEVKYRNFFTFLKHRARQILVPYFIFSLAFYAVWLAVHWRDGDLLRPLVEIIKGDPATVCKPFWYITCLFSMQIIYYFILRVVRRGWATFAFCAVVAGGYIALGYIIPDEVNLGDYLHVWRVEDALLFLPFYAAGNSFREGFAHLSFKGDTVRSLLLVALAIASMVVMGEVYWMRDNTRQLWAGLFLAIRIVAGLMVIPAYLCAGKAVASWLGRNKVVELIVVSGTVYLALQNYFIAVFARLLGPELFDGQPWLKFTIALLVMACIYPVAWFIDRHARWILGKK